MRSGLLFLIIVTVLFTSYSFASVIAVGNGESIQAAINSAAMVGDTIVVGAGTYIENLDLLGKAITLTSTDPTNDTIVLSTILDGNNSGPVITCVNNETSETVISGFLIINGDGGINCDASSPTISYCSINDNGGGVKCVNNSSPYIQNCSFIGNSNNTYGGGLSCDNSSPTVKNCFFSSNSGQGGGVSCINDSNPEISYCTFNGNKHSGMFCENSNPTISECTFNKNTSSNPGGGMLCWESNPIIIRCSFNGNNTDSIGGGMFCYNSNPTIKACSFISNSSVFSGGGMYCAFNSPIISNCSFVGNNGENEGGGVYCHDSSPTISDSSFYENVASYGAGLYCVEDAPTVSNCIFSYNHAYSNGGGIDCSAVNFYLQLDTTVVCGNIHDQISGSVIDNGGNVIGTYCPPPKTAIEGDLTGDGVVDMEDMAILARNWLLEY